MYPPARCRSANSRSWSGVETERLAELQAEDAEGDARRAECTLAMAEARRDQARLALDECCVKAPRPGTILRILVGPGDVLGADRSQPALLFAADGPQVIRATVEQEFAPRVKEGAPALVHDDADASLSWRGRVERVAGWYSQRRAVLHDPSQMSDVRTLECVIVLEPGSRASALARASACPSVRAAVIRRTRPTGMRTYSTTTCSRAVAAAPRWSGRETPTR